MSARGALVAGLCALVATCRAPQGPVAPDEVRPLALVEVQRLELEVPYEAFRVRKRPIGCWLDARGRAWVALLGTGVHVFGPEGRHELLFERREGSLGLYAPLQAFHESADGHVYGATHDTLEEFVPVTGEWHSRPRSGPLLVRGADGVSVLELAERSLAWRRSEGSAAQPILLRPRSPARSFQRAAVHGSRAVVCEFEELSEVHPPSDPGLLLHFLDDGAVQASLELPTAAWPAGLAFDGERATLVARQDEEHFELWLATPGAALARATCVEPDGLHEAAFTAGGELIVFLERRPGLVRYRLDLR